jgi:hypothetical protein
MLSAHSFNLQTTAVKAVLVKQMLACTLLGVQVTQPVYEVFSVRSNELQILLELWADHLPQTISQVLNMLTAKQKVHLGKEKKKYFDI